jgi:hypothetical protein
VACRRGCMLHAQCVPAAARLDASFVHTCCGRWVAGVVCEPHCTRTEAPVPLDSLQASSHITLHLTKGQHTMQVHCPSGRRLPNWHACTGFPFCRPAQDAVTCAIQACQPASTASRFCTTLRPTILKTRRYIGLCAGKIVLAHRFTVHRLTCRRAARYEKRYAVSGSGLRSHIAAGQRPQSWRQRAFAA